jgi:hypothetical protein
MPKRTEMVMGGDPLDEDMIAEVLETLETATVEDIASKPFVAGTAMADAALVIRAFMDLKIMEPAPETGHDPEDLVWGLRRT